MSVSPAVTISSEEIEVGDIFKIEADQENCIKPPFGRLTWYKHFVVMGKSDDGTLFGCVIFDSKINRANIGPGDDEFFIPVPKGKYSFIDHDSYIECLKLKPATITKLKKGKAEGRLQSDDLDKALELVKLSPRNGPMVLSMYNILKL